MDELSQGFQNDLSKTFDSDELFEKVTHFCSVTGTDRAKLLQPGAVCPDCGKVIKKEN